MGSGGEAEAEGGGAFVLLVSIDGLLAPLISCGFPAQWLAAQPDSRIYDGISLTKLLFGGSRIR